MRISNLPQWSASTNQRFVKIKPELMNEHGLGYQEVVLVYNCEHYFSLKKKQIALGCH